jgi:hypothetical protein
MLPITGFLSSHYAGFNRPTQSATPLIVGESVYLLSDVVPWVHSQHFISTEDPLFTRRVWYAYP